MPPYDFESYAYTIPPLRLRAYNTPPVKKKQKVIVIVGPTSSGKSASAVRLARTVNGEVISADSRQVYRGLDIGTGKITKREMKGVRHHLLDVASPKTQFTAHDFLVQARKALNEITERGHVPIIAGGTGFYVDALVGRIALPEVAANTKLRARLEKKSVAELFGMLKRADPARAKTIEPHNKRRLIRALEIAKSIGRVPAPSKNRRFPYMEVLWFGIDAPRHELDKKIKVRLAARLKQGMIAEARRLHKSGLSYKRMEELGLEYRALARFLQGKTTRTEVEAELFRDIRRYAKRQITYWKRNKDIRWLKPSAISRFYVQALTRPK